MRTSTIWAFGLASLMSVNANAQDITGNWQGTLQAGKGLRTIVKITKDDGKLKGMFYSIDQSPRGIAVDTLTVQDQTVSFTIKAFDLSYTGTLNPEHTTITGKSSQNGHDNELDLSHVTDEAMWPIPEPPKPMPADAKPKFDVVTVKPSDPTRPGKLFTVRGRHVLTINTTVNDLASFAYNVHFKQIVGAPDWFATDKFDIDGTPDVEGQPSTDQLKALIADALVQRFGLKYHNEKREMSVYILSAAKDGPKPALKPTSDKPSDPKNFMFRGLGDLRTSNNAMADFCAGMQGAVMDRPVVDHTGLTGRYDFQLKWTPDESQFAAFGHIPAPNPDDPNAAPSLYTALQEQLGLKMEAGKAEAPVMVIDHVEKPSAN